jgi:hypothetical protein
MIGVGRWINQRRGNIGRKVGFDGRVHDRTLWFALRSRRFGEGMTQRACSNQPGKACVEPLAPASKKIHRRQRLRRIVASACGG